MTMEQKSPRYKKAVHRFLLPNRIPNKIGIAVSRSHSASEHTSRLESNSASELTRTQTVLERPLSLDLAKLSSKNNAVLQVNFYIYVSKELVFRKDKSFGIEMKLFSIKFELI